jgi:hypothetical protein
MGGKRIIPVNRFLTGSGGGGGGGIDYFRLLLDVFPHSYGTFSGHAVIVNPGETGVTFSEYPLDNIVSSNVRNVESVPATVVGQPVYAYSATDQVHVAQANAAPTARVVGFTLLSVGALTMTTIINAGYVERSDWTPIIGTPTLTFGSSYFLSPTTAGMMTPTVPTTPGNYVVALGVAVSPTIFSINIGSPILRT